MNSRERAIYIFNSPEQINIRQVLRAIHWNLSVDVQGKHEQKELCEKKGQKEAQMLQHI